MDRREQLVRVILALGLVLGMLLVWSPSWAIGTVPGTTGQVPGICFGCTAYGDAAAKAQAYLDSLYPTCSGSACAYRKYWFSNGSGWVDTWDGVHTTAAFCGLNSAAAGVYGASLAGCQSANQFNQRSFNVGTYGAPACPSNASLVGGSCVCALGFRPGASACEPYTCPSRSLGSASYGPYASSSAALAPRYWCVALPSSPYYGCTGSFSPDGAFEGTEGWWSSGPEVYTGGQCQGDGDGSGPGAPSPSTDPSQGDGAPKDENPCAAGQVPGSVNGSTVCYTPSTGTAPPKMTTTTGPGGAPTGTTTEQTTCDNGQCTTTTTTKDGNGAVTGGSTSSEGIGEYCAAHPGTALCQGEGGPEDETPDPCDEHPERAGCASLGTGTDGESIGAKVQPMSITPNSGWDMAPATCPAPRTVALTTGFTLSMPFDLLCDFASKVRPIVIGVAWLLAIGGWLGLARKGS